MKRSTNYKRPFSKQQIIDYDIHGIVGVRVINPSPGDAVAVARQLGMHRQPLDRDPDIIIRFEETLATPSLRYLGLEAGFTDEGFYLFSSKENAKVRIPFEKIGGHCEILCESGLHGIPWLLEIINLTFLKKNYIPLHASAFVYKGMGILVTGWTKGGKSEALLSFANHGANFVGDECVILSGDGKKMYGTHVAICIWEWQFKHIPNLLPKIGIQRKILFKSIDLLSTIHRVFWQGKFRNFLPVQTLNQALPYIKRLQKIRVPPEEIFENQSCKSAPVHKLVLSMSHRDSGTHVEACDPSEIAKRMIHSNTNELLPLIEVYKTFKFAFPDLRNDLLENNEELQYSLLCSAFKNKEAYKVLHPYPVTFEDYFNQLRPYCKKTTKDLSVGEELCRQSL